MLVAKAANHSRLLHSFEFVSVVVSCRVCVAVGEPDARAARCDLVCSDFRSVPRCDLRVQTSARSVRRLVTSLGTSCSDLRSVSRTYRT